MLLIVAELPISNLPAEDAGVFSLVLLDSPFDVRRSYPGLATTNHTWSNAASLLVAVKDLGDAAVRDPQLAGDDTRTDPRGGHLDYLETNVIG